MQIAAKLFLLFGVILPSACLAQAHDVLCNEGNSSFAAELQTGVQVSIGPQKANGFSTHTCQATLHWNRQTLAVASEVPVIDLDIFGVELSPGVPVAAFATASATGKCCMTYQIYSVTKPAKLLRTITGGGFFEAADTDLDGDAEIWTDDSGAVNGFEGLTPDQIEFVPAVVLRFDRDRLLDASSEFKTFFDDVIAGVRAKITHESLAEFQGSDGKLQTNLASSAEELVRLHRLRAVKIQVLEIAWAYLYSGRETEAWRSLAEMWPAADGERIRGEILNMRARGIRSQLDGVTIGKPIKHLSPVFNLKEVVPARAILMRVYPLEGQEPEVIHKEVHLELVIDSAGKVRSVEPAGETKVVDGFVRISTARWKFIPAFRNGRPVAMRLHTAISAQQ